MGRCRGLCMGVCVWGGVGVCVWGSAYGEVSGSVYGGLRMGRCRGLCMGVCVWGGVGVCVWGSAYGEVSGSVYGEVSGSVYGEVSGSVYGAVSGPRSNRPSFHNSCRHPPWIFLHWNSGQESDQQVVNVVSAKRLVLTQKRRWFRACEQMIVLCLALLKLVMFYLGPRSV